MQFAESNLIWLLAIIPLIGLLRFYSYNRKTKELSELAKEEVIKKILPGFNN